MPRTENITCDWCGNDLGTTRNEVKYRLALVNQRIPTRRDGTVTAMPLQPHLDHDLYFCALKCLLTWIKKRYP